MTIPPAYQLALESFDLESGTGSERQEVLELLAPNLDRIADLYVEKSVRIAPYYREMLSQNRERLKQMITTYTDKLFRNPFDAQWVADTKERVDAEITLGFDMRVRGVVAQCILGELHKLIANRHRFSGRKAIKIADIAARVLMLDMANANAIHHHTEVRKAQARANGLDTAILGFGEAIQNVRRAIGSTINLLTTTSDHLANIANSAADHANAGSQAADTAAVNIGSVAVSADQLTSSIVDIRQQSAATAIQADEAASTAKRINLTIALLSEAVSEIGSIVDLIAKIAAQTNLLSLNATIEAARAGEKGKGFAVVASEVKSLAAKTSKATKQVGQQISIIEDTTRKSVVEIGLANSKIAEIANISRLLEASVTEQAAATSTIAEGVNYAAQNATSAANALKTVASEIHSTKDTANAVRNAAYELASSMREVDLTMDKLLQASSQNYAVKKLIDLKRDAAP